MWPTTSMPATRSRKPRTNTRKCGIQSAHQSLQTVVSAALPPALRNSHKLHHFADDGEACEITSKRIDNEHQSTAFPWNDSYHTGTVIL